MNKLRSEAKVTQRRYGINKLPASLLILEKDLIVKIIATQRATISIKAMVGFLSPKKMMDQAAFKINWIPKTVIAF